MGLATAGAVALALAVLTALAVAYPNLPDISDLADYRPKLPMRVYTADGLLIGEFGKERRTFVPVAEIPQVMKDAVLAIEDARFYQHSGVDYIGLARAALANLKSAKSQGASTITMQVARNVYLSSEKTFTRKVYEILLTTKLEHTLTKDQILEIYMNQIFLGNRAYGFYAAAETYFGKQLKDVTLAEAAMLAGLPRAPSTNNPVANFKKAQERQLYVLQRMHENGFITAEQEQQARAEPLKLRSGAESYGVHAEYVAEMARQLIYSQYGEETYTRGLQVYTTIESADQQVAYEALRKGIMGFERRQMYRGPERFLDLPSDAAQLDDAIEEALGDLPDIGDLYPAVVLDASRTKVTVQRANGERVSIAGQGLDVARTGLNPAAAPAIKLRRGAVVRISKTTRKGETWELNQLPEVEAAFVALDPRNGAVKALVGGFDYGKNKFNHVTQAWRQPGSSFKPFIYSAALEKGFSPSTTIYDGPLFFDSRRTGGKPWEPKNADNRYDGPMTMRRGLARSKNMISIRILDEITPQFGQEWASRFGFDADKHPAYLPMALGSGAATPMQMATAYSVFANGGYLMNPFLITRVTDHRGKVLVETTPAEPSEANRVIDARNAFITTSLLGEVARTGTAAKAQAQLKRPDIYGKTGTTNDALDAWFVGYQPTLAAAVWMGYDSPRSLGVREFGGGLSLPIWIDFMQVALKGAPVVKEEPPEGVVNVGGDWMYAEYADGSGVRSLGIPSAPVSEEGSTSHGDTTDRQRILDMFRE
nr:penicillin-binding protein 1A [Comamonas serinivorans]